MFNPNHITSLEPDSGAKITFSSSSYVDYSRFFCSCFYGSQYCIPDTQSVQHWFDHLADTAWYAVVVFLHATIASCLWHVVCLWSFPDFCLVDRPHCAAHADLANITLADSEGAVSRLSQMIKYQTVSDSREDTHTEHPEQLRLAREHLQRSYPAIWKQLNVETVRQACNFCSTENGLNQGARHR